MFTVLLVDDEDTILNLLQSKLPWTEMGVNEVLTAKNGMDALGLIREQPIALVISDICMPEMDGLTMVKEMSRISSQTHYILLTAHDKFEYAHAAISLGVENYLLKPVQMEELEQTVRRAITNIYAKRNGHWLNYSNCVLRWMTGDIESAELVERAVYHSINLYLPQYAVVCFSKKESISISSFCESCMVMLMNRFSVYYAQDEIGHHFMILGGKGIVPAQIGEQLMELARQQELDNKVSIGVGSVSTEALDLVQSYLSAMQRADLNIALGSEAASGQLPENCDLIRNEELQLMFYNMNAQNASSMILQYAERLQISGHDELIALLHACTQLLLSEHPNSKDQIRQAMYSFKNELSQSQDLQNDVVHILTAVWRTFEQEHMKLNPSVRLTIGYIRAEYASGVSIRDFCNRYSINPAYLGYLFKRECGVFFNEYLMRVRILHATALLRNPAFKVCDIALQTGFSSPSYFIKCFKSVIGMSPAKYRIERYHMAATGMSK